MTAATTTETSADDMMADAYVLFHVIDAANSALRELDFEVDGQRNRQLEHVDGLIQAAWRLARNLAQLEA